MRSRGLNAEQVLFQDAIQRQSLRQSQSQAAPGGEGDEPPSRSHKSKSGSTKQYVLRSCLAPSLINKIGQIVEEEIPEDDANDDDWSQPDNSILDWKHGDELGHLGILGFILALILMNSRSIENRQLLIYLRRLGISDNWLPPSTPACAHPPLTIAMLLTQFAKQGYLECSQSGSKSARGGGSQAAIRRQSQVVPSESNQDFEWRWGARAEIEFGEKQIAEFMSDIYRAAKGRVDDQTQADNPANKRKSEEAQHAKIMNDITKAAGSALQDSSTLSSL